MMALALLLAFPARADLQNVTVCMNFQIDFEDATWGDFWPDNSNRYARGLRVHLVDDVSTQKLWLDSVGCVDATVDVTPPDNEFLVRAFSRALVNGVHLEAHPSDEWEDQSIGSVSSTESANNSPILKVLPVAQLWQALAVGTWTFNRNAFNMLQGTTRDCCLSTASSYQADGTCSWPPPPEDDYVRIEPPVHFFTARPAPDDHNCGGSSLTDAAGVAHPAVVVSCPSKWALAHELGHVVVMMRMGGRDEKNESAPLDGCMADYWDAAMTNPLDGGLGHQRGEFTKEYMSAAFREGWATFFSVWAWNKKTEGDCEHPNGGRHRDFDLDGAIDSDGADGFDCVGTPYMGPDPPSPPMDQWDWLDDLEQAVGNGCDPAAADREGNRSTVYDVTRMFWAGITEGVDPVPPEVMADIYTDMCPRDWAATDTCFGGNEDEMPINRWLFGAAVHYTAAPGYDALDAAQHHMFHAGFPTCE